MIGIFSRIKALFTNSAMERDMDVEMRVHLDMLTDEYQRSGMPRDEAQRKRDFVSAMYRKSKTGRATSAVQVYRVTLFRTFDTRPECFGELLCRQKFAWGLAHCESSTGFPKTETRKEPSR